MSEIHIGPHTRDDAAKAHGDPHHTFDREIDLKSIGKWMGGLLVLAVIVQILMWWLLRGMETADRRKDPELTPIEAEVKKEMERKPEVPPEPRLQVGKHFYELNKEKDKDVPPGTRSDLEDMQALRAAEDAELSEPAWIDQAQGRLRVPIDVAMEVIAGRGDQMTRPQTPAPPALQEQ
jgi:hypothetical protein